MKYNPLLFKAALALLAAIQFLDWPLECSGAPSPKPPAWKVEIIMPSSLAASDPHQSVTIALINVGTKTLWVYDTNPLHDYAVVIRTSTGKVIPMTEHGMRLREGQNEAFTHVRRVPVEPGESIKSSIELRQFYQLSPGDYLIEVAAKSVREDTVLIDAHGHLKKKDVVQPSVTAAFKVTTK